MWKTNKKNEAMSYGAADKCPDMAVFCLVPLSIVGTEVKIHSWICKQHVSMSLEST